MGASMGAVGASMGAPKESKTELAPINIYNNIKGLYHI